VADKLPGIGSRWSPRGLSARVLFSSTGGYSLAGPSGAGLATVAALGAARSGLRIRTAVSGPRAQLATAAAEDVVAYLLALAACR
jgi:hypothetical protein